MMDIRKPHFNPDGSINCDIDHPVYGWIPFTAGPDDSEGRKIWLRCKAGEAGEIAPYRIPQVSFAERRMQRMNEIDAIAKQKRKSLIDWHGGAEIATWPIKHAEASAWFASRNDADAPALAVEAAARKMTVGDIAMKVIANSDIFVRAEAAIAGYRGLLRDRIRAVADGDLAALQAIDVEDGWPA